MTIVVEGNVTVVIIQLLRLGLQKLVNIIRGKRPHYTVVYQLETISRNGQTTTRYKLEFYNKKMIMTGGQLVDVSSIDVRSVPISRLPSVPQHPQALPAPQADDDDDWWMTMRRLVDDDDDDWN